MTLYFCVAALANLILIVPLLIFALLKNFYLDEKKGWTEPELMDRGEYLPVVIGLGIYSPSIAFFNLLLTHNFVLF